MFVEIAKLEFRRDFFATENQIPWAIVRRCLRDPTFSRFGTVPACVGQTDRQTHDDSIYRANVSSHGKNGS